MWWLFRGKWKWTAIVDGFYDFTGELTLLSTAGSCHRNLLHFTAVGPHLSLSFIPSLKLPEELIGNLAKALILIFEKVQWRVKISSWSNSPFTNHLLYKIGSGDHPIVPLGVYICNKILILDNKHNYRNATWHDFVVLFPGYPIILLYYTIHVSNCRACAGHFPDV